MRHRHWQRLAGRGKRRSSPAWRTRLSRQDAKRAKKDCCHFDQREKSFLDPSSLGMTGLGPSPWRPLLLCASPSLFGSLDPKFGPKIYLWLEFISQLLYCCSYARFRPAMSILSICIIAFITLFDFSASLSCNI